MFTVAKFNRPKSVPKSMQATYDTVVHLMDEFCDQHPGLVSSARERFVRWGVAEGAAAHLGR